MKDSFPLVALAVCTVVLAALVLPADGQTSVLSGGRRATQKARIAALEQRVLLLEQNLKHVQSALAARDIRVAIATPQQIERTAQEHDLPNPPIDPIW